MKIKIFVWQLLYNRLPSGLEVVKRHGPGDGLSLLCVVPKSGTHIFFSRPAASLWDFVREALGLEWQAPDLSEFLEAQTKHTGRRRRPFWLVFAVITWTQWTVRDKMVIKRVFLQCASDSV